MTSFMISGDFLFFWADDPALSLRPRDHAIDGLREFIHADHMLVASRCQDSCLVDQICQVSSAEPGCLFGNDVQVYRLIQRFTLGVYLQYSRTSIYIGSV